MPTLLREAGPVARAAGVGASGGSIWEKSRKRVRERGSRDGGCCVRCARSARGGERVLRKLP